MNVKPEKRWPATLGHPVDPMESVIRYRAASALTAVEMRDGVACTPYLDGLTYEQVVDVVRWSQGRAR